MPPPNNRRRYPIERIREVLEERARHRHSYEAWATYLKTLGHDDRTDILIYAATTASDPESLAMTFMAPLSSDLGAVIDEAFGANCEVRLWQDDEDVSYAALEYQGEAGHFTGYGSHALGWGHTPDGICQFSSRDPHVYDPLQEEHALAVCLAILDMFSPHAEELHAAVQTAAF